MKTKIIIWMVMLVVLCSLAYADTFVDDTQAEFDLGTYNNSEFSDGGLRLTNKDYLQQIQCYEGNVCNETWFPTENLLWYYKLDHNNTPDGTLTNFGKVPQNLTFQNPHNSIFNYSGLINYSGHGGSFKSTARWYGNVNPDITITQITFSGWVYPVDIASSGDGIIGTDSTSTGKAWTVINWANNNMRVYNDGWGSAYYFPAWTGTNKWYHLAFTSDETNVITYLNGEKANTYVVNQSWYHDHIYLLNNRGGADPFRGLTDEVMVWNESLSESQIKNLYERQSGEYIDRARYTSRNFSSLGATWNYINVSADLAGFSDFNLTYELNSSGTTYQCGSNTSCAIGLVADNLTYSIFMNSSNTTFTPHFNFTIDYTSGDVDITPPTVTLLTPTNASTTTANSLTFTGNVSDGTDIANITLWWNHTGTFEANQTNSSGLNNAEYSFTNDMNQRTIVWNLYACDSLANCAFAESNFTVTLQYPSTFRPNITCGMEWCKFNWT